MGSLTAAFQVWEHLRSWLHVPLHYSPRMLAADCALHVRCHHCHHCQWHVPSSWSCWELALIQPGSPSGPQEVQARTLAWSVITVLFDSIFKIPESFWITYIYIEWIVLHLHGLAKASPCLTHIPRHKNGGEVLHLRLCPSQCFEAMQHGGPKISSFLSQLGRVLSHPLADLQQIRWSRQVEQLWDTAKLLNLQNMFEQKCRKAPFPNHPQHSLTNFHNLSLQQRELSTPPIYSVDLCGLRLRLRLAHEAECAVLTSAASAKMSLGPQGRSSL